MAEEDDTGMPHLQGSAITYRIATGPLQGQKTLTLKTLPAIIDGNYSQAVKANGFSLHAGVVCQAKERKKAGTPVPLYRQRRFIRGQIGPE
ncbi:MAG: hypothetical protein HRU20_05685 [Pseudomonadales bacterium]|nr:hypothetical protein [Pseudomonadales bacterium]